MKRLLVFVGGVAVVSAYLVLSALPAFSATSGAVNASVTVATPCITINVSNIDFGSIGFSQPGSIVQPILPEGASSYTNCSPGSESVSVRGTDAQSTTSAAAWTLVDVSQAASNPCDLSANKFMLGIWKESALSNRTVDKTDRTLESAAAGAVRKLGFDMRMPCTGSAGAGEKMAFQYVLTASF